MAALALTNIGLAMVLSAPLSAMLAALLDYRPAAAQMVAGDDGLWISFFMRAPRRRGGRLGGAGAGVLIYGVLSWVLDGGALAALALDGEGERAVPAACCASPRGAPGEW